MGEYTVYRGDGGDCVRAFQVFSIEHLPDKDLVYFVHANGKMAATPEFFREWDVEPGDYIVWRDGHSGAFSIRKEIFESKYKPFNPIPPESVEVQGESMQISYPPVRAIDYLAGQILSGYLAGRDEDGRTDFDLEATEKRWESGGVEAERSRAIKRAYSLAVLMLREGEKHHPYETSLNKLMRKDDGSPPLRTDPKRGSER